MVNHPRKFKYKLLLLLILLPSVCTIISLAGCGGSGNIPSASILRSGNVTLAWEDVVGADAYSVYFSTLPDVTVLNSYKISNASNPVTITDLEPGTTYYFVVIVEDASGQSQKSKEISYTVVDMEGSIQFGDILSHSKPEATVSKFENVPEASPSGLKSATNFETQGRQVASTQSSNAIAPKPKKKSAVKASTSETSDITLAWDDVPNATSYNLYWSEKPGVTKKSGTRISNVKNPHKVTGLKKGKKYYFVVTAVNSTGESKESEEISFTVGQ